MRCILAKRQKIIGLLLAGLFVFEQASWAETARNSLAPQSSLTELEDTLTHRYPHKGGPRTGIQPKELRRRIPKILIVDDAYNFVQLLAWKLRHGGYEVSCAYNGEEGSTIALNGDFDLIISDINMPPGIPGDEMIRKIKQVKPSIRVIFRSSETMDPENPRFSIADVRFRAHDSLQDLMRHVAFLTTAAPEQSLEPSEYRGVEEAL